MPPFWEKLFWSIVTPCPTLIGMIILAVAGGEWLETRQPQVRRSKCFSFDIEDGEASIWVVAEDL
jgi:hypothetical protein